MSDMSGKERLRASNRVMKALEGLSDADQRGVVGLLALSSAGKNQALRKVLAILALLDEDDAAAVLRICVATVGAAEPS